MRALVTGGNRYIGLDLVFELAKRGHEVTVINSHEAPMPAGARRIHCDRTQPGALTAALNWYRAMDLAGAVGPVSVPTLMVWSTEDNAVGSAGVLATEKHVTGPYRLEIVEDVSHWIPEEAAEELCRVLIEHLLAHRN